jgi:hypothetical protein
VKVEHQALSNAKLKSTKLNGPCGRNPMMIAIQVKATRGSPAEETH